MKHPLTTNPEEEINQMIKTYETELNSKTTQVQQTFAAIRQKIDEHERMLSEKLADADLQNRKKIEEYQIQFLEKCKRVKERHLLFQQTLVNRDYVTILQNQQENQDYLQRMTNEWADLKHPQLIEVNIEGLDQFQAVVLQSIEKVRIVEQEPYLNQQIQQLISQQQDLSTLNLNNQHLNDLDTILIAQALANNTV